MTKPPFIKPIITYAATLEESVRGQLDPILIQHREPTKEEAKKLEINLLKKRSKDAEVIKVDIDYESLREEFIPVPPLFTGEVYREYIEKQARQETDRLVGLQRGLEIEKGLKSTQDERALPTGEYQVIGLEEDDLPTKEYTREDTLKALKQWKDQTWQEEPTQELKLEDIFPGISEAESEDNVTTEDQLANPMNKIQFVILYSRLLTKDDEGNLKVRGYEGKLNLLDVVSTSHDNFTFYQLELKFLHSYLCVSLDMRSSIPSYVMSLESEGRYIKGWKAEGFPQEDEIRDLLNEAVKWEEDRVSEIVRFCKGKSKRTDDSHNPPQLSPSMRDLKENLQETEEATTKHIQSELTRAIKIYEWIKEQERQGKTFYVSNLDSPQIDRVHFSRK